MLTLKPNPYMYVLSSFEPGLVCISPTGGIRVVAPKLACLGLGIRTLNPKPKEFLGFAVFRLS